MISVHLTRQNHLKFFQASELRHFFLQKSKIFRRLYQK
uniref:Uncharacterized protein n=1 Tax=Arundo donax TaxID=35708 RepID=A0A0A9DC82_ARUDO